MDNLEESVSSIDIKGTGGVDKSNVQIPPNRVTTTTFQKNPPKITKEMITRNANGDNKKFVLVNTPTSSIPRIPNHGMVFKRPNVGGGRIVSTSISNRFPHINPMNPTPLIPRGQSATANYLMRRQMKDPISLDRTSKNMTVLPKTIPKPSTTHSAPLILPKPIVKSKPPTIHNLVPLRPHVPKPELMKNTRGARKEAPRSFVAQSLMKKSAEMANEKEDKSGDDNGKKLDNTREKIETKTETQKSGELGKGAKRPAFSMDSADDGIIFVETTKKKRIRFNCPSLEFQHCLGFAANFSKQSADLTANPTTRNKYVGATYDEWDDSVAQYILKTSKKNKEIEEEEAEQEKRRIRAERKEKKGKSKPAATQRKEKERPFDPLRDRIIETPENGRLRRERWEYRAFLHHRPSRIEQILPFYRMRCIDGIIKTGDLTRENARIITTRVNPNPNLPYVLSTGVNKNMLIHNYLTGDTVNNHQAHHTYPTDGDWSYCGHYFIACGTDKLVAIVATEMNPCIRTRIYSENIPVGARFTQDRNIAIVAMETGMIDFFDLRDDHKRIVRRITGMPNITCIDTNPLDWTKLAVGCDNGMVTEYNFYDDHRKSTTDSYFQYFLPEMKSPIFNMLQFEEYDDFYDSTEVKSLRYCSSADSKLRNDLVVTKANRDKKRGDAAYKFSPKRNRAVKSYIPPEGMNISCASFAFNHTEAQDTKNGFCESFVVAGTEEGTVLAFDAETGELVKGGTAVIDDPSHQGNNDWRYKDMDREGVIDSYLPIRRLAAHEKNAFDPNLATRITAIDSIPDSHLGSFIVGGWGECPTINVFRFNDYSYLERYLHL